MGGVRRAGYLYDDPAGPGSGSGSNLPPILTWDGSSRVVAQDPAPKSQFLRALEDDAAREYDDAYDDDDDDDDEDEGGRARDDPDERRASDSDEDSDEEYARRRRGKWGRGGGGGGGGGGDAIESLRARMANHLLESTSTSPRGDDPTAASNRAKKSADAEAKAEAAAAAAASALESAASRLESESASWTDLSKACLHPRTARTLDGLWQGTHAFDGFGEGSEWCRSDDRREDLRDVVRRWAEECDALAGFHVAAEDLGGFGGLATAALEEIRDEHGGNVPVCVFSLRPPASANASRSSAEAASARRVSMLNEGLASATFAPETDAYIPVCASAWTGARTLAATGLDPRGRYRASAVAAAAMDVATSPWRVDGSAGCAGAESLRAVAAHLSARAPGPFAALTAYFPLAAVPDPREAAEAVEAAKRRRRDAERSGSSSGPGGSGSSRRDGDAVAAAERDERAAADLARAFLSGGEHLTPAPRHVSNDAGGAWDSNSDAYRPLAESYAIRGAARSASATATPAEARGALDAALSRERARAPRLRFASAAPLPLPLPFPRVFGAPPGLNPSSAPAMTRLASAAAFGGALRATEEGWRRAARGAIGRATLRAWGVADDDAEEIGETLATMRRGYDDDDDADDFSEDELDDA